jgi:lipoyl(octanoyl) transferase
LESIVINLVQRYNIPAYTIPGLTGVWVSEWNSVGTNEGMEFKIAAIGLRIRRWITMHGVSVNVNPDMRYFNNIIACGIKDPNRKPGTLLQFNKNINNVNMIMDDLFETMHETWQVPVKVYNGMESLTILSELD